MHGFRRLTLSCEDLRICIKSMMSLAHPAHIFGVGRDGCFRLSEFSFKSCDESQARRRHHVSRIAHASLLEPATRLLKLTRVHKRNCAGVQVPALLRFCCEGLLEGSAALVVAPQPH